MKLSDHCEIMITVVQSLQRWDRTRSAVAHELRRRQLRGYDIDQAFDSLRTIGIIRYVTTERTHGGSRTPRWFVVLDERRLHAWRQWSGDADDVGGDETPVEILPPEPTDEARAAIEWCVRALQREGVRTTGAPPAVRRVLSGG